METAKSLGTSDAEPTGRLTTKSLIMTSISASAASLSDPPESHIDIDPAQSVVLDLHQRHCSSASTMGSGRPNHYITWSFFRGAKDLPSRRQSMGCSMCADSVDEQAI